MESNTTERIERERHPVPLDTSGLGGWLVLVQIGLYASIVLMFKTILDGLEMMNSEAWGFFSEFHVLLGPLIVFEVVVTILILLFTVFVLIMFYLKKAILPRLMIILFGVSAAFAFIDLLWAYQIPLLEELDGGSLIREFVRSLLTCAIWIPYFIRSERVENTFVK
ncbi:hypothetical protein PAECIP111893_03451 [Paenibacillus plantiphilus]|uniref:DUF2569 domain-containing protein n=1 Tax=Paenibacillus plantiphilus TaxID=2905650 RepID=A0ABM9CGB8_9BACL|nr:DUF2569 domain-containing protein [Paenibacillus plantiphilus]CAH1211658.1 hypothetical protein PAECIP111893_03451 [Paenibacillus plantiphilus]